MSRRFLCSSLTALGFSLVLLSSVSSAADRPSETAPKPPAPKTVTLAGQCTPDRALRALADQTGITVQNGLGSEAGPPLTLSLKGATFWQALDTLAASAGAQVKLY